MTALEDHWFVRRQERQVGPLRLDQLQELARRGVVQASDLILRPGQETWIAARDVPALLGPIAVGSVVAKGIVALDDPAAAKGIGASDGPVAPDDAAPNADLKPPRLPKISSQLPLPLPPPQVLSPEVSPLEVSQPEVSQLPPPLPQSFVPETLNPETLSLETLSPETPAAEWDSWDSTEEIPKRNYFVRHWRGELPLPVAFWFNAIAGFILVAIAATLISASPKFKDEFAPIWMLLAICSVWLVVVAAVGWQVVGAWRSAGHYQRQKQPGRWGGILGTLAKAALAAAVLSTLFVLGTAGIPPMQAYRQIHSADAKMEKHTFQIVRGGRELEFSGGISFGVAKDFEKLLSSARSGTQSLQTVHLNSDGGRIVEAERIAALIKARGLDTYVAGRCLSACTTVFLAGRNRLAAPDARIGFHQPDFPGLKQLGVSDAFAQRANATPPNDLWYPSVAELLVEKVVTRVVNPSDRNAADQNPSDKASPGMGPPQPITGRSLRE